ncbi:MAG: PilZ domain-containing protein [Syntrophales bacterium]|nr:PilZ domain-containing protein [Syntrophales bacterium]
MLKPGLPIDVIIGKNKIRKSSVQDLKEDVIVILQTFPPLDSASLEKNLFITYPVNEKDVSRIGFWAQIVELREGYTTCGRGFPAVLVRRLSKNIPCDLRAYARFSPKHCLEVRFGDEMLEVVNISRGGAHLVRRPGAIPPIGWGDTIPLEISAGRTLISSNAKIVRLWHTKGSFGPEHLAVKFLKELPAELAEKKGIRVKCV